MEVRENLSFYKTALSYFVGKKIHLRLCDGRIDWEEAIPPDLRSEVSECMQCFNFFSKLFAESQLESFDVQLRAGKFVRWIDQAFEQLKPREQKIIFMSLIDWDIVNGKKKTLSNREIARRIGFDEKVVRTEIIKTCEKLDILLTKSAKTGIMG